MRKYVCATVQVLLFILPWFIRRKLLTIFFKFRIAKSARIGFSIILARHLIMDNQSRIQNLCFINEIDKIVLDANSKIGRSNWITGSSAELNRGYSATQNRKCEFILGEHSRITGNHKFDCNGGIYIGKFTTIAGSLSEFLTHGINLIENYQETDKIQIGDYCFIGTRCLLLKGSKIPNKSLLAAGSIVTKKFEEECNIYGGIPAVFIKKIPTHSKYFFRNHGNVS